MKSEATKNLWMLALALVAILLFVYSDRIGLLLVAAISIGSYFAAIVVRLLNDRDQ